MTAPAAAGGRRLPFAVKLAWTAWMAFWVPVYWHENGPANFLWVCDVANFVLLAALWRESALLFSSQAVGVLLIQALWAIDYFGALFSGAHPLGGTEYMFDGASPPWLRALSLFHLAVPPLLLWGVWRLGYDRRGFRLQTALVWLLLPVCYLFTDPERNLNWVFEPFGRPQTLLPPLAYLALLFAAYPLLVFLPAHLALSAWARRGRGRPRLLP
jgi:hypothetical protein